MIHLVHYTLNQREQEKLIKAIEAVFAIPFVDDVEDFIWESIFSYAKDVPLVDPLTTIRSKRLFDVVDEKKKIGWSAKAVQWSIRPGCQFELVIQRADIVKKAEMLGFKHLDRNSPTSELGEALLKHWYEEKVIKDAEHQGVNDKRVCILLKSKDRKKFAYFEEDVQIYEPNQIEWHWTDETKTGLQGVRKKDGVKVFRWYPNQTQFFENFTLPEDAFIFELEPKRISLQQTVDTFSKVLDNQ